MAAPKRKPTMTAEHKAKLAAGRNESRAVARYLEALEAHRPKQGRKRTSESVAKQLAQTEAELKTAVGIVRLELLQKQRDLKVEAERLSEGGSQVMASRASLAKPSARARER